MLGAKVSQQSVCQVEGKTHKEDEQGSPRGQDWRKTGQDLETQAGLPVSGFYMVAVCNGQRLCCSWDVSCLPKAVNSRLRLQVAAVWGRGKHEVTTQMKLVTKRSLTVYLVFGTVLSLYFLVLLIDLPAIKPASP